MTLKDIIARLQQGNLTPDEIAEFRSFVAVWLYRYYEEKGTLSAKAALWMTAQRSEYKSQAECERAWDATEDGQKLILKSNVIKGLEHIQEVLTSAWFAVNKEYQIAH